MEHLKKASDRFKAAHEDFFRTAGYAVGYGLDPARKGSPGVLVIAMPQDVKMRAAMVQEAKSLLPAVWEGFPVYVEAK